MKRFSLALVATLMAYSGYAQTLLRRGPVENVTDYAMIMEQGRIVEQGFVEELKEKYVIVKGEKEDATMARQVLYSISEGDHGFSGVCLAENLNKLAGMKIQTERATLTEICVAVMKAHTKLQISSDLNI